MDQRDRRRTMLHETAEFPDQAVADRVLAILETVRYYAARMRAAARRRGISYDQLVAAAITEGARGSWSGDR